MPPQREILDPPLVTDINLQIAKRYHMALLPQQNWYPISDSVGEYRMKATHYIKCRINLKKISILLTNF